VREGTAFFSPDTLPDDLFRDWWQIAPTEAQVAAQLALEQKGKDQEERAALVAAWRERNPTATCSDRVAFLLADLERTWA
jgi:anthranilate phosphoribosyltransferase